ncbi:protease inhibitor I42 family protein [bacterium]|nr:protease inhibitor I42 family protein [bacterium]
MKVLKVAAIVALGMCLAGCGGGGNANLSDDPFEATVRVDGGGLGGTINLALGETVEVALDENPTTGFTWHCTWVPEAGLTLAGDTYVADAASPWLVGGGGTRYFLLQAAQEGQVVVTLQYGRWWPGGEVQDPQTLTINVVP